MTEIVFSMTNTYLCKKGRIMDAELTKERITDLISRKGLTKAEFAKRLGISRTNLDYYLDAKKKDVKMVIKMAKALGMDLYEFIGYEEPEPPKVYGCLYVDGVPHLVNSRAEVVALLDGIE